MLNDRIVSLLEQSKNNQEEIIKLLKQLIAVTAASAIAEPQNAVTLQDRLNAANYSERVFSKTRD